MSIASDPKTDTVATSDDDFGKYFDEFAAGKEPAPLSEEKPEDAAPEGNDPEGEAPAPAPAATDDQPKDDVTSGEQKPEGAAAPEGEQAPDPWANVPDDIRERIVAIEKERDEARHKAQSDASRVAALSKKLQSLQAQPASATPAPAAEPTEAQKALDAKIKTLREDYGDIAEPLIELIESQKQELTNVRATLDGLSAERQAQVIAVERQALEQAHPDWQPIGQSEEFRGWLESQPQNIQSLATSWDARETSVLLTLYKAEAGITSQPAAPTTVVTPPKADAATGARRSQQLEGGRDVRSRPAPAASGPPEDFDAAFAYYEEQRRAKAEQKRR